MADQIYLNLWMEGFSEDSMLDAWSRLLEAFPASAAAPGVRGVAVIPFTSGEATALEQVFAEGATVEQTVASAREFLHPDYAYQAAMRWDVWRQKTIEELEEPGIVEPFADDFEDGESGPGVEADEEDALASTANETLGWKRVPMEVSITCLGPEFDAEAGRASTGAENGNPHFRVDLGLDTLFLPDDEAMESDDPDGWEEAALCYRDNIAQLLGFLRRIEKTMPLKSRLMWSASGEDLGERIRLAYSGA